MNKMTHASDFITSKMSRDVDNNVIVSHTNIGMAEQGFTLIELMIILIIIAIIASIALPSYQAQIRKNKIERTQSQLLNIALTADKWRASRLTFTGFGLDFTADQYYQYHLQNNGHEWAVLAKPIDVKAGLPVIGITSYGLRCTANVAVAVQSPAALLSDKNCGTDSSSW
ncbi:prepilin-type N-terminal cleavage/methylation domain-containing protein [Moraxella lacunata]|uniref:Pilin n=1 Tax=Moraxella lacunata TaxID=477 RepID=A0A1V4H1M1_MORLA|nr:prepilin-type N-terminal cleavage/methylation domain-containing protein [Moraxella lacunata]OPH38276.1 hypothetical protein B5J94_03825 [Moraxella lacunata]